MSSLWKNGLTAFQCCLDIPLVPPGMQLVRRAFEIRFTSTGTSQLSAAVAESTPPSCWVLFPEAVRGILCLLLCCHSRRLDHSASVSYDVGLKLTAMFTLDTIRTQCILAITSCVVVDINTLTGLRCHTHVLNNGNTVFPSVCVFAFRLKVMFLILTGSKDSF